MSYLAPEGAQGRCRGSGQPLDGEPSGGFFFDLMVFVRRAAAGAEKVNTIADYPDQPPVLPAPPKALNVPGIILAFGALLLAIHAYYFEWLTDAGRLDVLETFSFVPGFYGVDVSLLPSAGSRYWSPVTYGFLHGDWTHVGINCVWLVAFGTPVARRFGSVPFVIFTLAGFAAGAATHFAVHSAEIVPLVGASGAVSAYFGAAARFALIPGRMGSDAALRLPALSLRQTLTTPSTIIFIVVWLGINWVTGSGLVPLGPGAAQIAWEAHIGGFVLGLFGFALFDRNRR